MKVINVHDVLKFVYKNNIMVEIGIKPDDLKFKRELRALICGPSQIGKSTFVLNLLKNRDKLISGEPFKRIYWSIAEFSSLPDNLEKELPGVIIVRGFDFLKTVERDSLCVFDDVVTKVFSSELIVDLAVRKSSHEGISFIIISQNLYYQSRFARTIGLQMSFICLFNFLRDNSTYQYLCKQVNCKSFRLLFDALSSHLNEKPRNNFIIDSHALANPLMRYRSLNFVDPAENCGESIVHTLFLTSENVDSLRSALNNDRKT